MLASLSNLTADCQQLFSVRIYVELMLVRLQEERVVQENLCDELAVL